MISNRKMKVAKRIALVANDSNRKSLIEWSYYNQEILKNHELVATGAIADILEGTIGVPVTKLQEGTAASNHQLADMIAEQKIDILLFFWDPVQPIQLENGMRTLHDLAVASNIITACNLATADFVLSSVLMNKAHSVPVLPDATYAGKSKTFFNASSSRKAVLKLNTIN